MAKSNESPPYQGGSQPVPERPPEVPGKGRGMLQTVVVIVAVLVVLAALLWLLVPVLSA